MNQLEPGTRQRHIPSIRALLAVTSGRTDANPAITRLLRTAIKRGALEVQYQPILSTRGWNIVGAEALLRWNVSRRGSVPPEDFVALAERAGLIDALGDLALQNALTALAAWRRHSPDLHISVNVSPRQLEAVGFVGRVANRLRAAGVPPSALHLEITEGLLIQDAVEVRARLAALDALGVRIVLDDFGTGYSSLGYLVDLPIHGIKIDRRFCEGLPDRKNHAVVMQALLALARRLRLDVVAEGVETGAQAEWLAEHGVPRLQGFLFSRALPKDEFASLLSEVPSRDYFEQAA